MQNQTIEQSVQDLAHPDATRRAAARAVLVDRGVESLSAIDRFLETASSDYQLREELVRTRDWIVCGEDPVKLSMWRASLELSGTTHGNMLAGMDEAVRDSLGYEQLARCGDRIRAYLNAHINDRRLSLSIRAAIAILISRLGEAKSVPLILDAVNEEQESLPPKGDMGVVRLTTPYLGFFFDQACRALGHLTGEHFPSGLIELVSGVYETGAPSLWVDEDVFSQAIHGWANWWELYGANSQMCTVPIHQLFREVTSAAEPRSTWARFAINALGEPSVSELVKLLLAGRRITAGHIDLVLMLAWNGKLRVLPPGDRTTALIAAALASCQQPVLLRALIRVVRGTHPESLLRAIASILEAHPSATDNLWLFDPFAMAALDPVHEQHQLDEASEDLLSTLVDGLHSDSPRVRDLFLQIIDTLVGQIDDDALAQRVSSALQSAELRLPDLTARAKLMLWNARLGLPPSAEASHSLVIEASSSGTGQAAAIALALLELTRQPVRDVEKTLDALFRIARRFPKQSRTVLGILARLEPDHFSYHPTLTSSGVQTLIEIYKTRREGQSPDPSRLRPLVQRLINNASEGPGRGLDRLFRAQVFDVCSALAEEFGLPHEQFEALRRKALMLALPPPVVHTDRDCATLGSEGAQKYPPDRTLRLLQDVKPVTTFDVAVAILDSAAQLAEAHDVERDRILQVYLLQADILRPLRVAASEALFLELAVQTDAHPHFEARRLHYLSRLYIDTQRWHDVITTAEAMRAHAERWLPQIECETEELQHYHADTVLHAAAAFHGLRHYDVSLQLARACKNIYEHSPYPQHWGEALLYEAWNRFELGECDSALQELDRLAQSTTPSQIRAAALEVKSLLQTRVGHVDEVEKDVLSAQALRAETPGAEAQVRDTEPDAWWSLGYVLTLNGDLGRAREVAARLRGEEGRAQFVGTRLEALIAHRSGGTGEALRLLKQRLSCADRRFFLDEVALCYLMGARLHSELGDLEGADGALSCAEELARESGHNWARAEAQLERVMGLVRVARFADARALCEGVVPTEASTAAPDTNRAMEIMARIASLAESVESARADATAIVSSTNEIVCIELRARVALLCAEVLLSCGRATVARQLAMAAMECASISHDVYCGMAVATLEGALELNAGSANGAIEHFERAARAFEALRSAAIASGVHSVRQSPPPIAHLQLIGELVKMGRIGDAFYWLIRAKAYALLVHLHWKTRGDDQQRPIARYTEMLTELAQLEMTIAAAQDEEAGRAVRVRTELNELRQVLAEDELARSIFPSLGNASELVENVIELLNRGAASARRSCILCECCVKDEEVLVFVVDGASERVRSYQIQISSTELETFVRQYLDDVVESLESKRDVPAAMSELIERVAMADGTVDHVVIAGHGVLHWLPFHALDVEGQPVVATRSVSYVHSAAVLSFCQRGDPVAPRRAVVIGDTIGDLPSAFDEAIAIANLFGAAPLLGDEATKPAILRCLGDVDADVLHFACHGVFSADKPTESGLVVASPLRDNRNEASIEYITGEDFLSTRIGAQLVVLSACSSGLNTVFAGDELLGLTRAILHAGARSVIASLWPVHDLSTEILMRAFYERWIGRDGRGVSKAEALQYAQNAVRSMSALDVLEYCKRRIDELASDCDAQGPAESLDRLIHYLTSRGTLEANEPLDAYLPPAPSGLRGDASQRYAQRAAAMLRADGREESPAEADTRPFAHPRFWAPFILIGDWR